MNADLFATPITLTLSLREISSIGLALSRAIDSYKAQGNAESLDWCFGRAKSVSKELDKLHAIELAYIVGDNVQTECLQSIAEAEANYR